MPVSTSTGLPVFSSGAQPFRALWAVGMRRAACLNLAAQIQWPLCCIESPAPLSTPLSVAAELFHARLRPGLVVKLICCCPGQNGTWNMVLVEQTPSRTTAWQFGNVADEKLSALGDWFFGTRQECPLMAERHATGTASRFLRELWLGERKTFLHLHSSLMPAFEASNSEIPAFETGSGRSAGLLSGSFNPLHPGHQKLRQLAEKKLDGPVYYELPIKNADKPPLDYLSLNQRLEQFEEAPVLLSTAATFVEKSACCPNQVFVVGADTAARICALRFYRSPNNLKQALNLVGQRGCRFLVAPRQVDGQLLSGDNLDLPGFAASLFEFISPEEFCLNISSTELREQQAARFDFVLPPAAGKI